MAKLKFSITHNGTTYDIDPNGLLELKFSSEQDEIFYKEEVSSNLLIGGSTDSNKDSYAILKSIEDGDMRCMPVTLKIETLCNKKWNELYVGKFSMNDAVFNDDICQISLKIQPNNTLQCLEDNDRDINILQGTTAVDLNWFNAQIYEFLLCPNDCGPPLCNGETFGFEFGWREAFRNCSTKIAGTGVLREVESTLGSITPYSVVQGDNFVYYNNTTGNEALKIYDYGTDTLTTIFASTSDCRPYDMDGDYVGFYARETDTVYIYKISTQTITTVRTSVTNMGNDDLAISGDYMIYQDRNLNEVALYQISTATEIIIESANDVNQVFIDGNYCAYFKTSPNPDTLKVYNISGSSLAGVSVSNGILDINLTGDHLFWSEPSGGGREINHYQPSALTTTTIVTGTVTDIDSWNDKIVWIEGADIFLWEFGIGTTNLSSGLGLQRQVREAKIDCGNIYFLEFDTRVVAHPNNYYWYDISASTLTLVFSGNVDTVPVPLGSVALLEFSMIFTESAGAVALKEYVYGDTIEIINSNVSSGYTTFGNDCFSVGFQDDSNNEVYYYRGCVPNTSKILIAYRETTTAPCVGGVPSAPVGDGWQLYQNNCAFGNDSVWVRFPSVAITVVAGDCVTPPDLINSWYFIGCETFPTETVGYWYQLGINDTYERFRRLDEVIDKIATTICPNIQGIKSEFFQINPDTPSALDYVTGEPIKVNHLLIAQKSDIKRPASTEPASRGDITFFELMAHLTSMFQVYWFVDSDSYIRIEHITYFRTTLGLDLTTNDYEKYLNGVNSYSYDVANLQRRDVFSWMEAQNIDFVGLNIEFTEVDGTRNLCVGTSDKDHNADQFTTDVQYIRDSIALGTVDNNISDDGFVVCASLQLSPTEYNVYLDVGDLSGNELPNNKLSWANLQNDYWIYERPAKNGFLNGVYTTFETVKRTKLQDEFKIPFCCNDILDFDPSKLVKTNYGNGVIVGATYSAETDLVTLQLIYE